MADRLSRALQSRIDRLEPEMRRQVLTALEKLRSKVSLAKLEQALERGDQVALSRLTAGLPGDMAQAVSTVRLAYKAGTQAGAARIAYAFDAADPLSARAAERNAASMVTAVTDETRKAIRTAVAESFKSGLTNRDVAQIIKPLIGLTERQALAVLNRRAANIKAGWTATRIAADADRYAAKLLRLRAELIARTELAKASTAGQIEAWRQARANGQLDPSLVKTWIVTPDDRLCPYCEPLEGVQAQLDGTFRSGPYEVLGPPLHPQCRCAIGLKQARQARRRAA